MSSAALTPENNLTLSILSKAEKGKCKLLALLQAPLTSIDGIIAQTCYDAQSVVGLVRAAERQKSPAILQLFPITLAYGGGPFLQYCLTM
jgi:fructose-bisphosphate aldolase class II